MNNTDKRRKQEKNDVHMVQLWLANFILLAIALILAIVCYLCNWIWLYIICGAVLATFVIFYSCTTKAITHRDGYTLVQAIWFYHLCKKEGLDEHDLSETWGSDKLMKLAAKQDYAKNLPVKKVVNMFNVGKTMSAQLNGKEGH